MAFCPHCPHGWWQFILTEYPSFLHMATTATLDSSPWESSTSQNITVQKTLAGEVPFIRHPHLPLLFTVWLHHLVLGAPAFHPSLLRRAPTFIGFAPHQSLLDSVICSDRRLLPSQ